MEKYSQEFKDSTIQLIINNNVKEIAKDLDLNPKTLYAWVTAYKKQHNIPLGNNTTKNTQEESDQEELKQERDILKKATAPQGHFFQGTYFAKETL